MRKLLFLILVLFTANIAFSQITTNVSLKCQIYASSGTAPTFNVQSLVSDELSKYDGSSVATGDKLFIIDGSECYELHISSVTLGSGSVLNFVAYDSTGVLTTIPNGQAAVIRKYSIQQVPFIPSGLRSDLASCILQKIASTVNSVTGGSGVDNCTKSITQTAHGFSDGDVLYWDEVESEYVTFEGNYADASWPVYVVLDSLTANTFTGVSCGIIDEDFSLPEGLYYATNTGLSLTPAAVEYPVLKVYDGKAQVLAFPGLEFDAAGKELFDIVTPTGQRQINGGDVIDFHADSVRIAITIADTAATTVGGAIRLLKNNANMTELDSLAALPDVVGTDVLDRDILERDSLNNRWINRNYYLRHVNNSVFLGQGTPKITNHTNFMTIGYNALRGYSAAGSPNGVFAIGNNALSLYNVTNTEILAPFALGNNALRNFTGGSSAQTPNFAIGNNAGVNFTGTVAGTNFLVGNHMGIGLTNGWGNIMMGGDGTNVSPGRLISTGVGNTILQYRGFASVTAGTNYLTTIGFDNDLAGSVTSASNAVVIGSNNAYSSSSGIYSTTIGVYNRIASHEVIVGSTNGTSSTRTAQTGVMVGRQNFADGLGNSLTKYNPGTLIAVGTFNGGQHGKVLNAILVGTGNLQASASNYSIGIGLQSFLEGGYQVTNNIMRGDSMIMIGHNNNTPGLDSTTLKTGTVNLGANTVTSTAHGFGSALDVRALRVSCTSCPTNIVSGNNYVFEIVDANTLKLMIPFGASAGDGTLTMIGVKRTNNTITIGHNVIAEERKIKIGNTAHTQLVTNQYKFNIDQALGSGNDKQALRYNHSSGEIEATSDNLTFASVESTTDASGDVVVTHNLGDTPTSVQVTVTGTTPRHVTVHTKSSTQFTVRVYDVAGAALVSTSVAFDWIAKR